MVMMPTQSLKMGPQWRLSCPQINLLSMVMEWCSFQYKLNFTPKRRVESKSKSADRIQLHSWGEKLLLHCSFWSAPNQWCFPPINFPLTAKTKWPLFLCVWVYLSLSLCNTHSISATVMIALNNKVLSSILYLFPLFLTPTLYSNAASLSHLSYYREALSYGSLPCLEHLMWKQWWKFVVLKVVY